MNYYKRKKWYSKLPIFVVIARTWNNFWYEWHYPANIRYGGGPQGWQTFRKQRLFNVIIIAIVVALILYVL